MDRMIVAGFHVTEFHVIEFQLGRGKYMLSTLSGADVVRAYQILFSPAESIIRGPFSLSFVKSLDPLTVKNAFRKKALETHPDRARVVGREEVEQADLFRQVIQAYEVLLPVAEKCGVAEARVKEFAKPSQEFVKTVSDEKVKQKQTSKPKHAHHRAPSYFYNGIIPRHRLRLGHYLYYSGIITWQNLINAVSFHMRVKPRYGEIAVDWKMITRSDLMGAISQRPQGEMIGEYLKRSGLISDFQHLAILGKQRKLHCLFGEYFVIEGILSQRQLDIAVRRAVQHNKALDGFRAGFNR